MGLFLSDAVADVVVTGTPRMLPRLARAVETLGLPVRAVTPERAEAEAIGASLHCIESATLHGNVTRLPAVVVCTFGRVERRAGVACLAASHLTPTRLLGAMLDADLQVNGDLLERFVPTLPGLLMAEFLRHPLALASRQDLCSFLDVSRARIQALLRHLGCRCPAHFLTRCRAESWRLLVRRGIKRVVVERYVGMERRDNFARSCLRAGVPVPWEHAGSRQLRRPHGGILVRSEGNALVRSLSQTAPTTRSF